MDRVCLWSWQAEESSRPGNDAAFFASTAADGRVLFWDMRVWKIKKSKRCVPSAFLQRDVCCIAMSALMCMY